MEACVGGGSILLNKHISHKEIISDIDPYLISVYLTVKYDVVWFQDELRKLSFSEDTFKKAQAGRLSTPVNEYVVRRMSRGGMMKCFASIDESHRKRGKLGLAGNLNAWINSIEALTEKSARLENVTILNIDILSSLDFDVDFVFIDPPFLPSTRKSKKVYRFEMTYEQHKEMLIASINCKKKVLILGYDNELYNSILCVGAGWSKFSKEFVNDMDESDVKSKRILSIWKNY